MQKVHIYDQNGLAKWDSQVVMLGRIPCVGEFVRVDDSDTPALEVVRVIHHINDVSGTVAGITLTR